MKNKGRMKMDDGTWKTVDAGPICHAWYWKRRRKTSRTCTATRRMFERWKGRELKEDSQRQVGNR